MSRLIRWNPSRSFSWDRDPFDMMDRFMELTMDRNSEWGNARSWGLPLDVVEQDNAYVVRASIPGMNPDDIDITLSDNVLTIQGQTKHEDEQRDGDRYVMRERRYGNFSRSISLPMPVDADQIDATCDHGELVLTLPKATAVRPRRIAVNRGAGRRNVIDGQTQAIGSAQGAHTNDPKQDGHGFAEGQAELPPNADAGSKGWPEGQARTQQMRDSHGFDEGQAELPPEVDRDSDGWPEGQAHMGR